MDKVTFKGLIIPRWLPQMRLSSPMLDWCVDDFGVEKMKCQLLIDTGVATVDLYVDAFIPSSIHNLYKRATDLSRTAINMIALNSGAGVSLILDTVVYPNGKEVRALRAEPGSEKIVTAFDLKNKVSFSKSLHSALGDTALLTAIDDFVVGIDHHHMTEANCRRCLERLRHGIAPGIKNKKEAWKIMATELNIEQQSLKTLIDTTHANSHGEPITKYGTVVALTLRNVLSIINRYIEYRNHGSMSLREPDFPLLVL